MKKVLIIIGLLLVAGYIVFAVFFLDKKADDAICSQFSIVMKDNQANTFIDMGNLEKTIQAKGLDPRGQQLKSINTLRIEQCLQSDKLIKAAQVYLTSTGGVQAVIEARTPILRIMNNAGENYYIDKDGFRMPVPQNFAVNLPIATGNIKEAFATTDLYKFALFLYSNAFWNAQIEQIIVESNKEVTLIPRVGDQTIILGTLDDYEGKLDRLMTFYTKGLDQIGWNKYSVINLMYDNQIVCTKREDAKGGKIAIEVKPAVKPTKPQKATKKQKSVTVKKKKKKNSSRK